MFFCKNYIDSHENLEKRANNNDPEAQILLAERYYYGWGILGSICKQDRMKAFSLYLRAAEGGHPYAQRKVSRMYYLGDGTARDYKKRSYWLLKAESQGNVDAQFSLDFDQKLNKEKRNEIH